MIPSSGQNGLSRFESRSSRRPERIDARQRVGGAHLLGRLVVAESEVAGCRRCPSCVHSLKRPGRRAAARPTGCRPCARAAASAPPRTAGSCRQRLEQLQEPPDLGVVEAGADVADVAQLAALVHGEDERTEARRPAAGATRVAGDQELVGRRASASATRACGGPGDTGSRGASRRCPRAPARAPPRAARRRRRSFRRDDGGRARSSSRAAGFALLERLVDRAARRRARAGRTRSRRAGRCPAAARRSSSGRRSSSAQTSPSTTAFGPAPPSRPPSRARRTAPSGRCRSGRRAGTRRRGRTRPRGSRRTSPRTSSPRRAAGASPGVASMGAYVRLDDRAVLVVALDQQPVLLLAVEVRGNERERPRRRSPWRTKVSCPFALLLEQFVRPVVEDLDRPAAVLALRDLAVEGRVLERVVLDVDGQRACAGLDGYALRHGPRGERPTRSSRKS